MNQPILITCSCGENNEANVTEAFNHKDIIHCNCGGKLLVVDITDEPN